MIVAGQYDAHTMDPAANSVPTARACRSIYDTLIFPAEDGSFVPGLAESWEFLTDTAFKFNLRRGVKFHNGDEMKASDVRFSIMRATTDIGAEVRTYSRNVKDVEVIDDYTAVLHLKEPDYSFFSTLRHNWAAVYREINETVPMLYLHNDESIVGTQKNVKGFAPSPGEMHSFREVYFEE